MIIFAVASSYTAQLETLRDATTYDITRLACASMTLMSEVSVSRMEPIVPLLMV